MVSDKMKVARMRFRHYTDRHAIHSQQQVRAEGFGEAASFNLKITLVESKLEIVTIEVSVRVVPCSWSILMEVCERPETFMESTTHGLNEWCVRVRL